MWVTAVKAGLRADVCFWPGEQYPSERMIRTVK